MAGCISEIPMWKDSACLSTELQMSNDPSTREVSSAAQGIKMAQIVTRVSEKMSCVFLQIRQAGLLPEEKKEHHSESEIRHWIFSNAHYSSATLEHQPLHWHFIHTSTLVQALLQSSQLLDTSKQSAFSFDLVPIHSKFTVVLFITFLFQANTLSSIHLSTFGYFVSLESGDLYAVIFDTEARGTCHKDRCSSLQQSLLTLTSFHQLKSGSHLRDVSCWGVFLFHFFIAST